MRNGKQFASTGFFLGLPFDPEDSGDMYLRNDGISPDYMALQPRRPYSSKSLRENLKSAFFLVFVIPGLFGPVP
jgi:hypothetical protein